MRGPSRRGGRLVAPLFAESVADAPDHKLHVIVFGAHPDDAELKAGGVAAKWVKRGDHVKFVSVTNGDIGHWKMKPRSWPSGAWPR